MALKFAHGAIQWQSADVATTTYQVSGLTFQPKALRFYWVGIGSASDSASQAVHSRRGMGFATSTSDRRCVGSQDQDTAATSVCTTGYRTDCVAMTLTSTPAADGLLDISAIASDGFTLIVDDQAPVNITVFWEAWGDTAGEIVTAATGEIAEPAATGNQDYTVTGWGTTPSDGGACVFFAGVQATAAAQTAARNDSGFFVGAASGQTAANNIVVMGNMDDAFGTADTDGYALDGECLAMCTVGGGSPSSRATLTLFNANGFRLNWLARAVTSRKSIYLAIVGGNWQAGSYTIDGSSASATATVSQLPFLPVGVSLMGRMSTEQTSPTGATEDRIGLGTGSSASNRRAMGVWSEDGPTAMEIDTVVEYDSVLAFPSATGTLAASYDINAWNSDGFEIIVDTAGGVASEWQGYVAFGSPPPEVPYRLNNYMYPSAGDGISVSR